jgi:hypothetical protein
LPIAIETAVSENFFIRSKFTFPRDGFLAVTFSDSYEYLFAGYLTMLLVA